MNANCQGHRYDFAQDSLESTDIYRLFDLVVQPRSIFSPEKQIVRLQAEVVNEILKVGIWQPIRDQALTLAGLRLRVHYLVGDRLEHGNILLAGGAEVLVRTKSHHCFVPRGQNHGREEIRSQHSRNEYGRRRVQVEDTMPPGDEPEGFPGGMVALYDINYSLSRVYAQSSPILQGSVSQSLVVEGWNLGRGREMGKAESRQHRPEQEQPAV